MTTVSPSFTESPTFFSIFQTVPVMCAQTSLAISPLHRGRAAPSRAAPHDVRASRLAALGFRRACRSTCGATRFTPCHGGMGRRLALRARVASPRLPHSDALGPHGGDYRGVGASLTGTMENLIAVERPSTKRSLPCESTASQHLPLGTMELVMMVPSPSWQVSTFGMASPALESQ